MSPAMSSELVERLRERAESYRMGGPSSEHTAALLDDAAARLEALEAENARLREDRNRYERQICAAEHGHTVNDVLANYRQIRRAIQDRRAREGGNVDG